MSIPSVERGLFNLEEDMSLIDTYQRYGGVNQIEAAFGGVPFEKALPELTPEQKEEAAAKDRAKKQKYNASIEAAQAAKILTLFESDDVFRSNSEFSLALANLCLESLAKCREILVGPK